LSFFSSTSPPSPPSLLRHLCPGPSDAQVTRWLPIWSPPRFTAGLAKHSFDTRPSHSPLGQGIHQHQFPLGVPSSRSLRTRRNTCSHIVPSDTHLTLDPSGTLYFCSHQLTLASHTVQPWSISARACSDVSRSVAQPYQTPKRVKARQLFLCRVCHISQSSIPLCAPVGIIIPQTRDGSLIVASVLNQTSSRPRSRKYLSFLLFTMARTLEYCKHKHIAFSLCRVPPHHSLPLGTCSVDDEHLLWRVRAFAMHQFYILHNSLELQWKMARLGDCISCRS
jgi:hypothetical protein